MTNGVDQALPRILMPRTGADRQTSRDAEAGPGFDEALGNALKSRPGAETEQADADRDAPRFGARFGAAIQRIESFGRRFELRLPDRGQDDAPDAPLPDGSAPTTDEAIEADAPTHPRKTAKASKEEPEVDASPALVSADVPEQPEPAEATAVKTAPDETDPPQAQAAAGAMRPDVAATRSGESARRAAPATPVARMATGSVSSEVAEDGEADSGTADGVEPRTRTVQPAAAPRRETAETELAPPTGVRSRSSSANADASSDRTAPKSVNSAADNGRSTSRVTVISEQMMPAPAQSTSLSLATTLAASGVLKPESIRIAAEALPIGMTPAHSLSIQLHPAELGMVTASLKFVGDQLSIELQVENNEAYRALQTDSESLVKSLRGMGYEIDRVTILQPAAASSTQTRPDGAGAGAQQFTGSGQQSNAGSSASGGGGTNGQQPGGAQSDARQTGQNGPAGNNDRGAGGVYI
ncbi:MAG: flagellar hook-length control protein FliK [Alphaproteobacteria bacterium]|nr:flagellar hook-length control protein FliK [Alphaproteobacteria bacterium]